MRNLPPEVVRDVIQVTYRDSITDIDSFDLLISNYESDFSESVRGRRPKYEPPSRDEFEGMFDPGTYIELEMGYAGNLIMMLKGQILALEPTFPQQGGLTLSVRGLNLLHCFRAEQHTYAWEGKKDSEIASEIGRNRPQKSKPGIGFEVRVSEEAQAAEVPDTFVLQTNQYDISFLMERARRRNYELVLHETNTDGQEDPHIYFGPSTRPDTPVYLLEWGKSLQSFQPTLTTARQVSEVVVLGWDQRKNERIEGKKTWADLIPKRDEPEKARQQRLMQAFGNRREIVSDRPVYTQKEADDWAERILRDLRNGIVEASGETIGIPDLRAGRKCQIGGLGARFDGLYYVTETTHTIGDRGYQTRFKARREMTEK
jgi:phage protein D